MKDFELETAGYLKEIVFRVATTSFGLGITTLSFLTVVMGQNWTAACLMLVGVGLLADELRNLFQWTRPMITAIVLEEYELTKEISEKEFTDRAMKMESELKIPRQSVLSWLYNALVGVVKRKAKNTGEEEKLP